MSQYVSSSGTGTAGGSFEDLLRDALERLRGIRGGCSCDPRPGIGYISLGDVQPPPSPWTLVPAEERQIHRELCVMYCEGCKGLIAAAVTDDMLACAPELKRLTE